MFEQVCRAEVDPQILEAFLIYVSALGPRGLNLTATQFNGNTKKEKIMITKNDLGTADQSVPAELPDVQPAIPVVVKEHSRRRGLLKIGLPAIVAALALGLFGRGHMRGDVDPLQIIALAQGYSADNNTVLHVKGPSDVLQSQLIFQPGAGTGFHMHPGPVVVVVKSGALTEIHSDGCTTVHPAGSVFFEEAGVVHNAVNQTGDVMELYATFLFPVGTQPLIPVPDPGTVCRK
jgi:quercetin dioxygenase-like cupin family protein